MPHASVTIILLAIRTVASRGRPNLILDSTCACAGPGAPFFPYRTLVQTSLSSSLRAYRVKLILLSPLWQTFRKEFKLKNVLHQQLPPYTVARFFPNEFKHSNLKCVVFEFATASLVCKHVEIYWAKQKKHQSSFQCSFLTHSIWETRKTCSRKTLPKNWPQCFKA